MAVQGVSSGLQTRELCRRSLEWAIEQAILPAYERTGKYREPAEPPHRLNFGKNTWMLAHYADWRGMLYRNEDQWRRAFAFVDAFTAKHASPTGNRAWPLPHIFGSFGGIEPANVLAGVRSALLRQGFVEADAEERSFTAVFRHSDSCETMDLPEPYGKWLQKIKNFVPWKERINLCVEAHCKISAQPRLMAPYGTRSFLDLTLSAPAAAILPPLREHLSGRLHPAPWQNADARPADERMVLESLRTLILSW